MKKNRKKEIKASVLQSVINIIKNDVPESKEVVEPEKELSCRVCGFEYDEENAPWQEIDGNWFASFEICVCCNVHFGYEDVYLGSVKTFREKWISNGAEFHYKGLKPKNWSLEKQLKNIPKKWRTVS